MPFAQGTCLGPYETLAPLGGGGMGVRSIARTGQGSHWRNGTGRRLVFSNEEATAARSSRHLENNVLGDDFTEDSFVFERTTSGYSSLT